MKKTNMTKKKAGEGVEIFFICEDALAIYTQITSNGISASEPFVGTKCGLCRLKTLMAIKYHLKVLRMYLKKQNILSGKNDKCCFSFIEFRQLSQTNIYLQFSLSLSFTSTTLSQ
jgi:hypothetical protein